MIIDIKKIISNTPKTLAFETKSNKTAKNLRALVYINIFLKSKRSAKTPENGPKIIEGSAEAIRTKEIEVVDFVKV
ncbi:hypothetical protein A2215_02990 [Candidatus Berkelbacteria bacterium RIFOXYA2_FULL_43_10]|uniref:Uncharacterized protein n=1 Tax=Candidatus Berkelbacteria bacterium RIFOXYA2_FULL_43_10 TaxID=1797472 RepID=A0A1F5E4P3_9BACT|nr:MAG: hypothetical protein A2215_02990 [Candidatus Berkelbacteria bacterium RIFOXYA2_FULL_43_10]